MLWRQGHDKLRAWAVLGHGTCFAAGLPDLERSAPWGWIDHPSRVATRPMRTLMSSLAFVWLVLTLPASLVAQEPAPTGIQNVLTPGDSVRITVWRKPEFSGDYVIAPD